MQPMMITTIVTAPTTDPAIIATALVPLSSGSSVGATCITHTQLPIITYICKCITCTVFRQSCMVIIYESVP